MTLQKHYFLGMMVVLLAGSVFSSQGFPHASQEVSGEELYEQLCSRCHGKKGGMGIGGIPKLKTSRIAEELILLRIREGSGDQMPAFADSLSAVQLKAVASYVQTLRK